MPKPAAMASATFLVPPVGLKCAAIYFSIFIFMLLFQVLIVHFYSTAQQIICKQKHHAFRFPSSLPV